MTPPPQDARAAGTVSGGDRRNNFGSLRLLLAILVILSHSPVLVDGLPTREILTRIFGTLSFGQLAVDGFFLISGHLVTQSFERRRSTLAFLKNRCLRILPAYLVCFAVCFFLVAPLAGATGAGFSRDAIGRMLLQVSRLLWPEVPGAFAGLPHPALNGSMWTIAYEFRCYLAVALLGLAGALAPRQRRWLLAAVLLLLALNATGHIPHTRFAENFIGTLRNDVHFFGLFGTGMLYYLLRDRIRLTGEGAVIAALLLAALLFHFHFAELAVALFGGYLLFWFAFRVPVLGLSRWANRTDISYGLYLYAWPVQNLVVWHDRSVDPWLLFAATCVIAGLLGLASWVLIEKPCLLLGRRPLLPVRAVEAAP